jgi:O-antigen ligase
MATALPSRRIVEAHNFELQMKLRRFIAQLGLGAVLYLSLYGVIPLELGPVWLREGGSAEILRQALVLLVLGLQLLAPTNARPPMAMPTSLLILLGYCLLTCTWAIDPGIALRRLAFTAAVIWMLMRAIGDLGAVRTQNFLRVFMVVLLIVNFLVVAFSPLGKHLAGEEASLVGEWRGIISHKNVAGPACCFTILLFVFDSDRVRLPWRTAVVIASGFFLFMTGAKTAIAMLALSLSAGALMHFYNPRHRSLLVPVGVVATALSILYLLMYSGVMETILDDPFALSGRGAIWPLLLDYAGEHLWTGAGFGSFWQIGPRSPIYFLTSSWVATAIGHGHNGFLDLLVTIGLPGLVLAILIVFVWPAIRLLCSVNISRSRRALLWAIVVFCAGSNITETTLLDRVSTVQVFLMIAIILIHRLSDQSAGAHKDLRDRLLKLASRQGWARARRQLAGAPHAARNALGWRREPRSAVASNAEEGGAS